MARRHAAAAGTAQVAAARSSGRADGFEPVANLPAPEREQLPAAPLVMAAYAVVWVMVFGYLWSIWRRLGAVERELRACRGASRSRQGR